LKKLRREVEHLGLGAPHHDAVQLRPQLLEVARAVGHPAEPVVVRRAVAFGEREEAPAHRVADELEQREEIARAVGERRPREGVEESIRGLRDEPAGELAPPARVVLEVVRFVENQPGPGERLQELDVLREDVVVDDDPLGGQRRWRRSLDHEDGGVRRDDANLARPVLLD
jgi:hypothetical protein